MLDSVSELFNGVYEGLGSPDSTYLERHTLANIFFRQLAYRLEQVRQSEQRVAIAKSSEFTLGASENSKVLTTLETDFVIPLWVERQMISYAGRPVWQFVPTVNLTQLASRRALATPAVSFYGGDANEVIAEFSYYGGEVPSPCRITRVWYSPTVPVPNEEGAEFQLPDNLKTMVMLDCMVRAIPMMVTAASGLVTKTPELAPQIQAWTMMLDSHKEERAEFQKWFTLWCKGSRGGHRSRRRRDVLRRSDSSNNAIFGINVGT